MKLWELYPEVRNLYEEYNGILLEDDFAWKELTEKAEQLIRESEATNVKKDLILYIAMGNLVVNKELYNEYNDKFSSNWNAKYIFRDLERLNPQFYPIPVKTDYTVEPKRWVDIDEAYLTKDEAVKIYDKCGGLMHVPNPYGSQVDVFYYEKMIPIWYKKIFYLLNQHVIHMVGGEQMYCIVMCGDKNGNPHGYLFESVQNEPD